MHRQVMDTKIHNFSLRGAALPQVTLLVLLDLSAAFDTIDHDILLIDLHRIGVRCDALCWLASYLTHSASVSTVTRLTEPDCDTEFHRAVCWALYFSLFTALVCHISSKRMVFVTMCTLTTHNSMLTFHLTIRRLQPTIYPGVSST